MTGEHYPFADTELRFAALRNQTLVHFSHAHALRDSGRGAPAAPIGVFQPIDRSTVGGAASRHVENARTILKMGQPALVAAMRQATMFNRARFACVGGLMDRCDLPGLESLSDRRTVRRAAVSRQLIHTVTQTAGSLQIG